MPIHPAYEAEVNKLDRDKVAAELTRPPTVVHYTKLEPSRLGDPFAQEWDTYVREIGRLLAEGHNDDYVVIRGGEILGVWSDKLEALAERYRHPNADSIMVRQIREWEPLIRVSWAR